MHSLPLCYLCVCRTVSMFVEYSFELELYGEITFWQMNVKPSCVQIGIHKRSVGRWPCLLHDASRRLPWLTFDAEHALSDSSDDEGSDSDADSPLMLVSRKYFLSSLQSVNQSIFHLLVVGSVENRGNTELRNRDSCQMP